MENGRSMEDIGREYFKQLLSRSFFHTLKRGSKMLYVMHDLIHDLAQMVSDGDCMRIEGDMSKNVLPTVRHLSVSSKSLGQIMNQYDLKRLRTLIVFRDPLMPPSPIPNGFLAGIKNVRTLDFSGCDISELPEAIGLLTHLRYMALPDTIKILPESVSRLLHLQTFDIPKKCQFDRFPEGMHQLASLRHLSIDSKYISMIRGIGSLVNLQGSVEFHVKKEKGQTLEELKDMNNLHGVLSIQNLENVQCREEACKAQLAKKRYVQILKLEWSFANTGFGPTMDADVLDCLQPHPNLEELHITRYEGVPSPRWLEMKTLFHLKSLYLANCRRWMLLPALGQLPFLRVLRLKEMSSVIEIGLTFYGGSMAFPSLNDLEFDDMPNLVCWKGGISNSFFPSLQKLKISDCPKLVEVPLLSHTIKRVAVERSQSISHLKLAPYCSFGSSKFTLEISSASILSEGFLHQQHLEATEVLNIRGCWGSVTAENFQVLRSLRKLRLCQCDMDGARLNSCLQHLTDLAFLEIIECQYIMSFVLPVGSRYSTTLQHLCFEGRRNISSFATLESFTFLKSLIIERCPRVTAESLPSELKRMISLNKLSISHCSGFESLPSSIPQSLEFLHLVGCDPRLTEALLERQGPEWDKVAFISQITVY
jgi:Leucine-rich repeat (LRR) protein